MFARDVEMFIEHCENKGLATKTIGSYEQTLRLLMLWLDEQGITQTEKITHVVIQDYVKQIKERGKYTVTSNPNSGNYQERRIDFGKKVSDVTINNYLRNMSAFFNWCVEEGLILRSPVKRRDYIKVERRPLEFVSDEDFRKLLRNMNTASFSEYRDYIIIQLLLDTGMRINECLMIQVTDVNLPKHMWHTSSCKRQEKIWILTRQKAISKLKTRPLLFVREIFIFFYGRRYECAAKFYEIRVKEKTNLADKNAREDELQMKTNELRIEADKAEKAWKTEVAKVVAGIASTALGAFLMIHHDRFWAICSAGGVQVFDDRYRDGKTIYKDYGKKSV